MHLCLINKCKNRKSQLMMIPNSAERLDPIWWKLYKIRDPSLYCYYSRLVLWAIVVDMIIQSRLFIKTIWCTMMKHGGPIIYFYWRHISCNARHKQRLCNLNYLEGSALLRYYYINPNEMSNKFKFSLLS